MTNALSRYRKARLVEKDIVNREVTLVEQCFFIFRLRGHKWTQIIARDRLIIDLMMNMDFSQPDFKRRVEEARKLELNKKDAKMMSVQLSTRALFYGISDTSCALNYELYEKGKLIEQLETGVGYEICKWKRKRSTRILLEYW